MAAGSNYDLYARLLIRYLGKYIPGRPTIVPENMPGASSLSATNYLFNVAPRDGSVIGAIHERMGLEPRVAPKGTRYDGREFTWIGSMQRQVSVCLTWAASGFKTVDDMKQREMIAGGSGRGRLECRLSAADEQPARYQEFCVVNGYDGAQTDLALERGEVDSRCGLGWTSVKSQHADWLAAAQGLCSAAILDTSPSRAA